MTIFRKRPLAIILCIMLGGFFLFTVSSPILKGLLIVLSLISLCFVIFHKRFNKKLFYKITVFAFILAILLSLLYFGLVFFPDDYEESVSVTGIVTQIDEDSLSYARILTVESYTIDGKRDTGHKIRLILNNSYIEMFEGYVIKFHTPLSTYSINGATASDNYYISRGYCAEAEAHYASVIDMKSRPISSKFTKMREDITDFAISLTDEDCGGLLGALLLGERDAMNPKLNLAFKRIGITHILALSGMHLVILSYALSLLLSLFKTDKKKKMIINIIFVFLFMALTGFPASVMRAGIMLILSSVIFMLSGARDGITSLCLAFAIIIFISPYHILDIGLWLSAIASFAIIAAGEYLSDRPTPTTRRAKIRRGFLDSLYFSVFALSATFAVSVVFFDTTSALSIIATPIFGFLTEIYLYLGIIVLLIGKFIPIGGILVLLEDAISVTADAFASIPYCYYSVSSVFIKILGILLTVSIFAFFILKIKQKKKILALIILLFVSVNLFGIAGSINTKAVDSITYSENSGERILIASNNQSALIDINARKSSGGMKIVDFLIESNITELDDYVLISYTSSTPYMLLEVLSEIHVDKIHLPMPQNEDEETIIKNIYLKNRVFNPNLCFYYPSESIMLGKYEFLTVASTNDTQKYKYSAFALKCDEQIIGYVTPGALEYDKLAETLLYKSDILIIGKYGKKPSQPKWVDLTSERLKTVVINTDKIKIDDTENISENVRFIYKNHAKIRT